MTIGFYKFNGGVDAQLQNCQFDTVLFIFVSKDDENPYLIGLMQEKGLQFIYDEIASPDPPVIKKRHDANSKEKLLHRHQIMMSTPKYSMVKLFSGIVHPRAKCNEIWSHLVATLTGRACLVNKRCPISFVDISEREKFLKAFYNEIVNYQVSRDDKRVSHSDVVDVNDSKEQFIGEHVGFSKEATTALMQLVEVQKDIFDNVDDDENIVVSNAMDPNEQVNEDFQIQEDLHEENNDEHNLGN
ncbi:hypothetical protein O6H91_22G008700 [Diphasiastrum complanatum]|uniref:Uncharacterized protein n=1 Tax=Diphasiastrum complanatum TaxID=34168 RepID=A0ACC2ACP0_DIPCM|nr:hypothetical protein O6H91_22G008700 [Diphasiastrum complanatum]